MVYSTLSNFDWQACSPSWKQTVTSDTYYAYGKCSDVPFGSMNTNNNKFFAVPFGLLQTGSKIFYMVAEFGFSSAIRSGVSIAFCTSFTVDFLFFANTYFCVYDIKSLFCINFFLLLRVLYSQKTEILKYTEGRFCRIYTKFNSSHIIRNLHNYKKSAF